MTESIDYQAVPGGVLFRCQDCYEWYFAREHIEELAGYCGECEEEIEETVRPRPGGGPAGAPPEGVGGWTVVREMSGYYESLLKSVARRVKRELEELARFRRDGYVYVVGGEGYYKIGRTTNVHGRLKRLKIQLPWPVRLVHTIPCEKHREAEAELHRLFAKRRANGEWFRLTPEEVAFVKRISRMRGADIDAGGSST